MTKTDRGTAPGRARLAEYTTFRIGGDCPELHRCPDAESLLRCVHGLRERGVRGYRVVGQGSNLLVADAGVSHPVLRFYDEKVRFEREGDFVRVEGSTPLDAFAAVALEHGWGDLSFCSGIPGTVGGAIAGNAGAFGRQIGDLVRRVRLLGLEGETYRADGERLHFEYRDSRLRRSGEIVLEAELYLPEQDPEEPRRERERILQYRRERHPDWRTTACAGSVFRNIEPGSAVRRRQSAGWFLEQAGMKGAHSGRLEFRRVLFRSPRGRRPHADAPDGEGGTRPVRHRTAARNQAHGSV